MNDIDWKAFLAAHDMHFNALPSGWQESPHFGNAMIGSMLYMRGDRLCLEIFRADVCDHRDESYGWTAYSRPHFRIGHFTLETAGTPTGCNWRKDLWNAELNGTLTTDRGEIRIRHLVHAQDMAIVTEWTPCGGEMSCRWSWHPAEARTTRAGYPANPQERDAFARRYGDHYSETLKPFEPNPAGRLTRVGQVSVWIQDLLAGGGYATAWGEGEAGGKRTLLATIANTFPESAAADIAVADIAAFMQIDRSAWLDVHRDWWHRYYPRSYVSIPDKDLESLYWQSIYRFGCCSRAGRYYVDTSGLWFQGGQWPYTTNDWNTQAAHWGVYAANRLEQGEEVVNRLHENRDNLIRAVLPAEWQEDSAYLHLATAGDMAGSRRSDRRYYDCVGCLPWLLHNAWWQYRFSMDNGMLRDTVYPLLRRAINLYLHLVQVDEDGVLHLVPTYSPETEVCADANFDLALFQWGCHTLLHACRRLNIDDPLVPRWREVIERLVDFPADEKGFMLGGGKTAWDHHRHLSHLLMIYPLYLVNIEQQGVGEVLKRSSNDAHRSAGSDGSVELGNLHAMVQTHAGPIAAALGDGDRALEGVKRLQSELHPNGLWSCGGNPCIESTLSVVNNIQEMLLQSWSDPALDDPGPIRIFPALPSDWQDVEFRDLRAEGAFLVSAKRTSGVIQWVRIKSLAGEPCRVRVDIESPVIDGVQPQTLIETAPGIFRIDLKQNETIILKNGTIQSIALEII